MDLEQAMDEMAEKLGVRPVFGGYHPTQGTKNALLNLSNNCYLELLAADPKNMSTKQPRWMGIDFFTKPQITRWALNSDDLQKDQTALRHHNSKMGGIQSGSRKSVDGHLLQWELIMPLPEPEVEITPFMINWNNSHKHPSEMTPNSGCELIEISATHPEPNSFTELFQHLNCKLTIQHSKTIALNAQLKCPKGLVTI